MFCRWDKGRNKGQISMLIYYIFCDQAYILFPLCNGNARKKIYFSKKESSIDLLEFLLPGNSVQINEVPFGNGLY
jgi:hypothetical protein